MMKGLVADRKLAGRMPYLLFLLFLLLFPMKLVPAADLAARLDELMTTAPAADRTNLALRVVDLESGEVLYDRNGRKLFTPASNLKIYTSACALDLLGPEKRFQTVVQINGTIEGDTLKGELVLKAGGDPMLKTEGLRTLARRVKEEHGIKRVDGFVSVDDSLFALPKKGPGWMWDDDFESYNMSIAAIMVNFNAVDVVAFPGSGPEAPAKVGFSPLSSYPVRMNDARTRGTENTIRVTRDPFQDNVRISGNIPVDDKGTTVTICMHDPARYAAAVFHQVLAEEGVRVRSYKLAEGPVTTDKQIVLESVPVSEAVRHFNKTSENAVGEMLLHQLTLASGQKPTSWDQGAGIISKWLVETAGLEEGSFRLVDGSGLSRYNLISPESSTDLLQYMWTHPHKQVFFDSLPVYKVELPEGSTADPERVHAKPGGMAAVSTMSGYIQTLDGRWLAFSFLGNGYIGSNEKVGELRRSVFKELVKGE